MLLKLEAFAPQFSGFEGAMKMKSYPAVQLGLDDGQEPWVRRGEVGYDT